MIHKNKFGMKDSLKIEAGVGENANKITVNDKITISVECCDVVKDKCDIKCCTIGWTLWLDGGISGTFKRIAAQDGRPLQTELKNILDKYKSDDTDFNGKMRTGSVCVTKPHGIKDCQKMIFIVCPKWSPNLNEERWLKDDNLLR